MKDTKVIANYLPQYHQIPENDKWWGKGYTDWDATRRAKPLFMGHEQPKSPQDGLYYDLSNPESIRWQANMARQHGIYGFGIYHYWFSSDMILLQKPAEIILKNSDIDIHYMFIWDNASWKRTWSNVRGGNDWAPLYEKNGQGQKQGRGILAELKYGKEDEWEKHFLYLLPFFRDERYIKTEEGKPLFMFFNMDRDSDLLTRMGKFWNELAIANGFPGIALLGKVNYHGVSLFDFDVDYEPGQHGWTFNSYIGKVISKVNFEFEKRMNRPHLLNYDRVWKRIIHHISRNDDKKRLFSAFVNYDDSPRRGKNGHICVGASPEKFEKYMSEFIHVCRKKNKEFAFITAWNEWGEGAYLEPDNVSLDSYLLALKNALHE